MRTTAKALSAFERIENKTSQIKALSIMAHDSRMEELSTKDISHFFAVIIELTDGILSNLTVLDTGPTKEQ